MWNTTNFKVTPPKTCSVMLQLMLCDRLFGPSWGFFLGAGVPGMLQIKHFAKEIYNSITLVCQTIFLLNYGMPACPKYCSECDFAQPNARLQFCSQMQGTRVITRNHTYTHRYTLCTYCGVTIVARHPKVIGAFPSVVSQRLTWWAWAKPLLVGWGRATVEKDDEQDLVASRCDTAAEMHAA